ncbi:hypothetical protein NDU88_004544 [Pleurodeles waltl]|uniref:Uncharacterized protein n=1 Tax=Pleurodeles waltl TaxID=8319 RepID=A0AAV7NNS0_PLEWA|nr:hypothetical protein NDU88_004544 [Pleurodeles waltl]
MIALRNYVIQVQAVDDLAAVFVIAQHRRKRSPRPEDFLVGLGFPPVREFGGLLLCEPAGRREAPLALGLQEGGMLGRAGRRGLL